MIYIVRHGETEWNKKKIIQGMANNEPLNKNGMEQAKKLAEYFSNKHLDLIISSPLKRAIQTASYVALKKNIQIILNENFSEIDYGDWSGKKSSEIPALFPEAWKKFIKNPDIFKFPNGEAVSEFYTRVSEAFCELDTKTDVLIVAHTNSIRAIVSYVLELSAYNAYKLHFDNCSVSKLRYKNNRWEVDSLNCKIM